MKKRKKTAPKHLSNRQKVKEQAKELNRLRHEHMSYKHRNDCLRATVLEKQKLINEKDRTIEFLKSEIGNLKVALTTKKPFWKRVLG